jgi:hypothetical protein
MPEIPQNFTNDGPHEKLESCSRKISKTPSRAESHCIDRNTENELSARDSLKTISSNGNHIVRRNNEGDSSTAADATAPRRRRRRAGNRLACVNDHQPRIPESAGEHQADEPRNAGPEWPALPAHKIVIRRAMPPPTRRVRSAGPI